MCNVNEKTTINDTEDNPSTAIVFHDSCYGCPGLFKKCTTMAFPQSGCKSNLQSLLDLRNKHSRDVQASIGYEGSKYLPGMGLLCLVSNAYRIVSFSFQERKYYSTKATIDQFHKWLLF